MRKAADYLSAAAMNSSVFGNKSYNLASISYYMSFIINIAYDFAVFVDYNFGQIPGFADDIAIDIMNRPVFT